MYVSSFNTFVQATTTNKIASQKIDYSKGDSFNKALTKNSHVALLSNQNPTINYISKNNYFTSKLEQKEYQQDAGVLSKKFKESHRTQDAKKAYEENSNISFLFQKVDVTISDTKTYNSKVAEKNAYSEMINTYIENDKYFQITA